MKYLQFVFLMIIHCQGQAQENLFPHDRPGKEHIRAGLKLIKEYYPLNLNFGKTSYPTVFCDTNRKNNYRPEGTILPADFSEDPSKYTTYGENNLSLCIAKGGSKCVIKINQQSNNVVMINMSDVHLIREYYDYEIINAFGLISQQNPEIVTVKFNDGTQNNAISAFSFDYLTKNTSLRTWDLSQRCGYGDISIFNGKVNLTNIDYNVRLISAFVQDMALWHFLGMPGGACDSPNLIFKQVKGQTFCRLFLYDINSKTVTVDKPCLFTVGQTSCPDKETILKNIQYYYKEICYAPTPTEKVELEFVKGDEFWRHAESMFSQFEFTEALWTIFETEYARLNALFEAVQKERL